MGAWGQNMPGRKKRRPESLWQNHAGYTPAKRRGVSKADAIREDTKGTITGDREEPCILNTESLES